MPSPGSKLLDKEETPAHFPPARDGPESSVEPQSLSLSLSFRKDDLWSGPPTGPSCPPPPRRAAHTVQRKERRLGCSPRPPPPVSVLGGRESPASGISVSMQGDRSWGRIGMEVPQPVSTPSHQLLCPSSFCSCSVAPNKPIYVPQNKTSPSTPCLKLSGWEEFCDRESLRGRSCRPHCRLLWRWHWAYFNDSI